MQYGPDATRRTDFAVGGIATLTDGTQDVIFFAGDPDDPDNPEHLGFFKRIDRDALAKTLKEGRGKRMLNHDFFVIEAPSTGLRGDTHDSTSGAAFLDGILLINGKKPISDDEPFHLLRNPDAPPKPKILAVSDTSITVRLELPEDLGADYGDTFQRDDQNESWQLFISTNGVFPEIDEGVRIDWTNFPLPNPLGNLCGPTNPDPCPATPIKDFAEGYSITCDGEIHRRQRNLIRTSPLECTISNLDPETDYAFQVGIEMPASLCDERTDRDPDMLDEDEQTVTIDGMEFLIEFIRVHGCDALSKSSITVTTCPEDGEKNLRLSCTR